jgi:hypothetical protein
MDGFRQPNEPLNAIEATDLNPDLDNALAYLISAGIASFGVWIVAHAIGLRVFVESSG